MLIYRVAAILQGNDYPLFLAGTDSKICSYELPTLSQMEESSVENASLAGRTVVYTLPSEFKISGKGLSKVPYMLAFPVYHNSPSLS